jgi:hypothetical protein
MHDNDEPVDDSAKMVEQLTKAKDHLVKNYATDSRCHFRFDDPEVQKRVENIVTNVIGLAMWTAVDTLANEGIIRDGGLISEAFAASINS